MTKEQEIEAAEVLCTNLMNDSLRSRQLIDLMHKLAALVNSAEPHTEAGVRPDLTAYPVEVRAKAACILTVRYIYNPVSQSVR
jgi:hypothetical protein